MNFRRLFQISLFWRTFVLLVLLILASSIVWYFSFRTLESESRAMLSARQISSAVNLTRSSLIHADAIYRTALIKNISEQEGLNIRPRETEDKVIPYELDHYRQQLKTELQRRLGGDTVISDNVNGTAGLWVSFDIQGDKYWLQTELERMAPVNDQAWLYWVAIAIGISLFGAAIIAGLLNQPLKHLAIAVNHVRLGNFDNVDLHENLLTTEIQDLNRGFNKMSAQLSKVETDRTVMLAGISHDLRTPLARLRLETELSVADSDARTEMSLDIEQINSILGKFLDYARPQIVELQVVNLLNVVSNTVNAVNNSAKIALDISASYSVANDLQVMADPVELSRVLNNLLENARRYGKSTIYPETLENQTQTQTQNQNQSHSHNLSNSLKQHDTQRLTDAESESSEAGAWEPTRLFEEPVEIAQVHIDARIQGDWVILSIKDNGSGVSPEVLNQLNVPFFRANEARTNTTGTGLGLAIVEKAVQSMQGKVKLSNWGHKQVKDVSPKDSMQQTEGGFLVEISLKRPPHKVAAQKAKAAQLANSRNLDNKIAQNSA
jgi:two-component system, OmpR family, osmolarity sensor histidine kinase EnvZ